ncbi:MAG: ABC transporter ATP-binding protein [Opitutales bacterium]
MKRLDREGLIEVANLKKSYGATTVLQDVAFRVLPGQTTILTGDNGAGKTTLLRVLAGLSLPTGGTARIAGRDIGCDRRSAQAGLSFLPQGLTFHPTVTPERLVQFYASIRGRKLSGEQVAELLDAFELLADRRKPVRHLSGGMVQRLGLALLLLPDVPVLLLDEPAISLDPAWRRRLGEILRKETGKGKAVFLTTHLPQEWEGEAHQHLCCRDGRVVPAALSPPLFPS